MRWSTAVCSGLILLPLLARAEESRSAGDEEPPVTTSEVASEPAEPSEQQPQEKPYHPEPRVIVTVDRVVGPHRRAEVERAARLGWGRIVSCYKGEGSQERGKVLLRLRLSGSGKVTSTQLARSTFKSKTLAKCLTRSMKGLAMPAARASSTATTEITLSPGDPPRE